MKIAAREPASSQGGTRQMSFARGEAASGRRRSSIAARSDAAPRPGTPDHRGIRRHHRRAAGRDGAQGCHRLHRAGVRSMKVDPDHLCGHQERARFDRRRHGLHGGADRALRDRQGRDGFFGGPLRRRRPDGRAGQDHRPASRRDPRSDGVGAGEIRGRSSRRRRRHHERSLSRRHASARHLHVRADLLMAGVGAPSRS